jgi:FkbM family methyltransferase
MAISSIIYKSIVGFVNLFPKTLKNKFFLLMRFTRLPTRKFVNEFKYNGKFKVKYKDISFYLNGSGGDQENLIFWKGLKGWDEPETIEIIYLLKAEIKTFIDIGANTGIYSLFVKSMLPDAEVIAFEPSRTINNELSLNLQLNNLNIRHEAIALSNKTGELTFYDSTIPHQTSASLSERMNKVNPSLNGNVFEYLVKVDTLDNYIFQSNLKDVSIVKIDVELHEPEVFEGMINTFRTFKPYIVFECLFQDLADKLELILHAHGYNLYHLEGGGNFKLVKVEHLSGRLNKDWNYFACHQSKTSKLEAYYLNYTGLQINN